jgi:hypothetical protein
MSANLCVESHLRDAEEKGFIAHESITAEEALKRLEKAVK